MQMFKKQKCVKGEKCGHEVTFISGRRHGKQKHLICNLYNKFLKLEAFFILKRNVLKMSDGINEQLPDFGVIVYVSKKLPPNWHSSAATPLF